MYLFGEENKRRINLGGASTASTSSSILDEAKHRRLEREDRRRRHDNAIRIQAWWRGRLGAKTAKVQLREVLAQNPDEITALRCLVLLGKDDKALARWSEYTVRRGPEVIYESAKGPHASSWLTLMQQVVVLLLRAVADAPTVPSSATHLNALDAWLSPRPASSILGPNGDHVTELLTGYAVRHGLYTHLSGAIGSLCKTSTSKLSRELPTLTGLCMYPFRTFSQTTQTFQAALSSLISYVLTIPALLSKLPTTSIVTLSSGIPFQHLSIIIPDIPFILDCTSLESKIHLLATLVTITQPRYLKLSIASLDGYLRLLSGILNVLPVGALSSPSSEKDPITQPASRYDSDSEDERPIIVTHGFFKPDAQPLPKLDLRTLKRLAVLVSPSHVTTLLSTQARTKPSLILLLLALENVWPEKRPQILSAVLSHGGGGILRELYRGYVRSSGIGRDDQFKSLSDPATHSAWPSLLFLADLYTRLLLTMGDDEFFQTSESISADHRNPLTLDEVTALSRQLLNVAFMLYMREDQFSIQETGPIMSDLRLTWEAVREKVKGCLVALHARDSRRRFTPPNHWHVSSQLDMKSFVDAAIFEEQELSSTPTPAARSVSKRQTAYLSPRLGILNNIPFAIPFETRVSIFRHFVASDMLSQASSSDSQGRHTVFFGSSVPRRRGTYLTVRRDHVAQDGFDKLSEADLKGIVQITFIDQFGNEEAGIDGGGVFKEFFTSLCKEVFDTDRGLWLMTKNNELYPNPHAYARESHSLNWYRFIGRILGKAMYEGILVDVAFAGFFLAKWLGKQSFLDDLASLDQELYSGLVYLKHYDGNPEDLSLNFTIAVEEFGANHTFDLIPNGSNIPITRENKLYYIQLVSQFRLSRQIKRQSDAFFDGLSEMMDVKWLRMFNQQEVQILISGVNSAVDLDDLRKHTNYAGIYDDDEETVTMFWKVVNGFNHDQRRALLRFVTSCSRPPLLGFKELVPNFAIRHAGNDENRLPTSSTCVNLLKLPKYRNERQMREKLLQAITSGAGFDLS